MKILRKNRRWQVVLDGGKPLAPCLERLAQDCGFRVGELCVLLGCSQSYLYRVFRRDIGLSPKDWLRQQRMVLARRQLVFGRPMIDVAAELGFCSAGNLGREFRSVHGLSPLRFLENKVRRRLRPRSSGGD